MNKKLKSYWAKHVEQPASIKDIFEAMGVGFLDLEEAFALYHPCVLEKRLPSEMPMSVQEKFFSFGLYDDGRDGLGDVFDRVS